MRSTEMMKSVVLQVPKDINGLVVGANVTAISLRNYQHAVMNVLVGNLAANMTIALQQALNVGGNGLKTLGFTEIFRARPLDTDPEEVDLFTKLVVAGNSYTVDNATQDNNFFKVEIRPAMLDVSNGFDCVRPNISAGAGVTLLAVWFDLFLSRYRGLQSDKRVMPSALSHG